MEGRAEDTTLFYHGSEVQAVRRWGIPGGPLQTLSPQEAWACCLPLGALALSNLSGTKGQFTLPLRLFILFHI